MEIDSEGEHYAIPKPLIIDPVPFEKYSNDVLNKISEYFTFQETVLNIIINYMSAEVKKSKIKQVRKTTYPYKSFKFKDELIETGYENINIFFKELSDKIYINTDSLKSINDAFHGSRPKSKIVWKTNRTDLWYLISQMEKRKFITGTKRNRAKLISAVFVLEDGTELTERKLDHLHAPTSTIKLDQILGILGPSPQSRYTHS